MTYYICHDADHIDLTRECTKVPYSDRGLYDIGCDPRELTLVGLSEDKRPGPLPDKSICIAQDHSRDSLRCAMQPIESRRVTTSFNGVIGHNWAPFYDRLQYVYIRARIATPSHPHHSINNVRINIGGVDRWIKRDDVLALAKPPYPDEPDRKSLLRSKQNQRLSAFSEGMWRSVGGISNDGLEWPDLWTNYGPFDIFTPDGEVK